MKVLIPSYQRCGEVEALGYALSISDDVVISVQTEDDRQKYTRCYGDVARIVYRHACTAAGNRNTALSTVKGAERALMLDDDVKRLVVCSGPKARDTREATRADIDGWFSIMETEGVRVGGFYPVNNPYFAYGRKGMTKKDMLIGAALLFVGQEQFNESYRACEDYELCLRLIAKGEDIIRFNHVLISTKNDSMKSALSGKTSGGLSSAYRSGEHARCIRRLYKTYRPLAKLGKNGTSIQIDKRFV